MTEIYKIISSIARPIMNCFSLSLKCTMCLKRSSSVKRHIENSEIWSCNSGIWVVVVTGKFTTILQISNFYTCCPNKNKKAKCWDLGMSPLQALRRKSRFYLSVIRKLKYIISSIININFHIISLPCIC